MPEQTYYTQIQKIRQEILQVIHAKDFVVDLLLNALISEGHVLLNDVPGVGKTTLAKSLAKLIDADCKRIQFTSDLMPSDVCGSSIFNPQTGSFSFYRGPIFANLLLADEINRASPRTQSALLEAMSEYQVSVEGVCHELPKPFMVIATENPIEYYGTFPLPEAQLDRFLFSFSIGYPEEKEELAMLNERWTDDPLEKLHPVMTCEELKKLQKEVRLVTVEHTLQEYMVGIIRATREPENGFSLGASPRAFLDMARVVQARAYLHGRMYAVPEDITELLVPVLAHRLILNRQSHHAGLKSEDVLHDILKKIRIPV